MKSLMLELIRHSDTYTAAEVLDSWTADNREYYASAGGAYLVSEHQKKMIGGKEFLMVEEKVSFDDEEEEDGVYTTVSYTCVFQYEEMTMAIEIWFYDVESGENLAAEVEELLSNFMAVTVTTPATN
jgi:hypothetical protein